MCENKNLICLNTFKNLAPPVSTKEKELAWHEISFRARDNFRQHFERLPVEHSRDIRRIRVAQHNKKKSKLVDWDDISHCLFPLNSDESAIATRTRASFRFRFRFKCPFNIHSAVDIYCAASRHSVLCNVTLVWDEKWLRRQAKEESRSRSRKSWKFVMNSSKDIKLQNVVCHFWRGHRLA